MSFDSRGFSDRNSQYFNKPTRTWERWKSDGEAVFEDRNRSGIPRPRRFRHRLLLRSPAGAGAQGSRGEEEGRGGAKLRVLSIKFYGSSLARRLVVVRRECLTAAVESHAGLHTKLTFLPTAMQSFYPFPDVLLRERHRAALISPLRAPSLREFLIHSLCFAPHLPSSGCEGALPCPNLLELGYPRCTQLHGYWFPP